MELLQAPAFRPGWLTFQRQTNVRDDPAVIRGSGCDSAKHEGDERGGILVAHGGAQCGNRIARKALGPERGTESHERRGQGDGVIAFGRFENLCEGIFAHAPGAHQPHNSG